MKTSDPLDPLDALLSRQAPVVVRPDFLDRVIAATHSEPQEAALKIIDFPTSRRTWFRVASLAAVACLALGVFFALRPQASETLSSHARLVEIAQVDDSLEQELTAVQDMQTLIALDDPSELDDAQLLGFLN